jgi:AcrR family transcriptional regulator
MRFNRAGFYKAFGSKHELFISALHHYQQALAGSELLPQDFKVQAVVNESQ